LSNIADTVATGNQQTIQKIKNAITTTSAGAFSINASKALTGGSKKVIKINEKNTIDFLHYRFLAD
jgi:hypothetical protein